MTDTEDSHKVNWLALPNHCFDETDPQDLIDFPVSDDFLRHYHAKGMTPRCPEPNVQAQLNEMAGRLERLEVAAHARPRQRPAATPVYQPMPVNASPEVRKEIPPTKQKAKGVGG